MFQLAVGDKMKQIVDKVCKNDQTKKLQSFS